MGVASQELTLGHCKAEWDPQIELAPPSQRCRLDEVTEVRVGPRGPLPNLCEVCGTFAFWLALRHTFLLRQGLAMCLGTMSAPS